MQWYWQRRTEVLINKAIPVPLFPPQSPCGLALGLHPAVQSDRPAANQPIHGTAGILEPHCVHGVLHHLDATQHSVCDPEDGALAKTPGCNRKQNHFFG